MTTIKEKLLHRLVLLLGIIVVMNIFFMSTDNGNSKITGNVIGIFENITLTGKTAFEKNYNNTPVIFIATLQDENNNSAQANCFLVIQTNLFPMTKEDSNYTVSKSFNAGIYPWSINCILNEKTLSVNDTLQVLQIDADTFMHNSSGTLTLTTPLADTRVLKNATLEWILSNTNQTAAEIILATDATLKNNITEKIIGNKSSYTPVLSFDTEYYWKVITIATDGILESNVQSFHTNKKPVITQTNINAGMNSTKDTIILSSTATDPDTDETKIISNWKVNGKSIYSLYLPIEGEDFETDYSGNERTAQIDGTFTTILGSNGLTALHFTDGSIVLPNLEKQNYFTLRMTIKPEEDGLLFSSEDVVIQEVNNSIITFLDGNQVFKTSLSSDWQTIILRKNLTSAALFVNNQLIGEKEIFKNLKLNNIKIMDHIQGTIDELRIYNRALSKEQILAEDNKIVSQELQDSEDWNAELTPFDKEEKGEKIISPYVRIQNQNISITLNSPSDTALFQTKDILLNWSITPENINATYIINVSSEKSFQNTTIFSTTNKEFTLPLQSTGKYYWNILANFADKKTVSETRSFSLLNTTGCFASKDQISLKDLLLESGNEINLFNTGNTPLSIFANITNNMQTYQVKIIQEKESEANSTWMSLSENTTLLTTINPNSHAVLHIKTTLESKKGIEKSDLYLYCQ